MDTFFPHWGVPGGIVQTIIGSQFKGKCLPYPSEIRHEINIDDQTTVVLFKIEARDSNKPIILLAHGMGGCSASGYIKRISTKLWMQGYGVFLVNHRGSGPGMGLSSKLWNGGSSNDLSLMINFIIEKSSGKTLLPIGFSLSGNILLKYLGEEREVPKQISGALAVNPPIDLRASSYIISRKKSCWLFNRYYMKLIRNQAEAIASQFPNALNPLKNIKTIWDFDVSYTAPVGGYKNVEHYYDQCSSMHYLKQIGTPTAILCARDDPFIPAQLFDKAEVSSHISLHRPDGGGHMGYIAKTTTPYGDCRWMDYFIMEWVKINSSNESLS